MGNGGANDASEEPTRPRGDGRMSNDSTWIIVVTVAVIVAVVSITAIMVAVALPQLSRIAADMRHHEARMHASNNDVVLELQRLFDGMLDDYRERAHDMDELV
jgi:hypothetical protein